MMARIKIILFYLLLIVHFSYAQETLSLKDAVSIALQNNYNIVLARNETFINEANNTLGNAGFLPKVAVTAGQNYTVNNTKQEFFSGDVRQGSGVNSNNLNANVLLTWTVFDGMKMFANKERLKEIEAVGRLNMQLQMENTISQVMLNYYNIEQQHRRIETIEKAIAISKERHSLARLKKNVGTGSAIEILQAEVDINADSSSLLRQEQILKNAKIQLNQILARAPETDFNTISEPILNAAMDYNDLVEKASKRNTILRMAESNIRLASLSIKQSEAGRYPSFDVNLGYNFTRFQTEIGVLKFNQNRGLSFGLTGRWDIFNGWNNKREIQIAKLRSETSQVMKEQSLSGIKSEMYTSYNNYLTALELQKMEERNIKIAQQNLDISTEKMRLGTINALDLRQAQLNLVDAEFRKITATFEARIEEIELLRLSGDFSQ